MYNIIVHINSALPHFSQLLTGLEYLRDKNLINLKYRLKKFEFPPYIFKVEVEGKQLFFDLSDNSEINQGIYEKADKYVKRMLLRSDYKIKNKLLPYGLNYGVYYNNPFLRKLFLRDRTLLKYSLRYSYLASRLMNIKNGIQTCQLSKMQSLPYSGKKIVFRSRLWDPGRTNSGWKKEERNLLNKERIELHSLLQKSFGDSYRGGIETDPYTRKVAKKFLLSKDEYHKRNYLKILQNSSIGIVNQGLENSIGWKFGEYISHSLAIVTNPIDKYQLLGPLKEEEHYLTFGSPEECIEKSELLLTDSSLRRNMQQANHTYYEEWLHPGQKLLKIFQLV